MQNETMKQQQPDAQDGKPRHYLYRMNEQNYKHLKQMAAGKTSMNEVLTKGLETMWDYDTIVKQVAMSIPHFESVEQLEQWRLSTFKDNPHLLAKYAAPTAIVAYTRELERQEELKIIDQALFENASRQLRAIGSNINQLAKRANMGQEIPMSELSRLTKATIDLKNKLMDALKKEGS